MGMGAVIDRRAMVLVLLVLMMLMMLMVLVGVHLGQGHRCKQTDDRQSRQCRSHGQSIDERPSTMQPPVGGESSGWGRDATPRQNLASMGSSDASARECPRPTRQSSAG
jgi:hypothetical protein